MRQNYISQTCVCAGASKVRTMQHTHSTCGPWLCVFFVLFVCFYTEFRLVSAVCRLICLFGLCHSPLPHTSALPCTGVYVWAFWFVAPFGFDSFVINCIRLAGCAAYFRGAPQSALAFCNAITFAGAPKLFPIHFNSALMSDSGFGIPDSRNGKFTSNHVDREYVTACSRASGPQDAEDTRVCVAFSGF